MNMQELQDAVAVELYGMTASEAQQKGICLECKEPALPKCYSNTGRKEYGISGLCEQCFDELTKEEDSYEDE